MNQTKNNKPTESKKKFANTKLFAPAYAPATMRLRREKEEKIVSEFWFAYPFQIRRVVFYSNFE